MLKLLKSTLYWIGLGLLYIIRILAVGTTLGIFAFILLGPLFVDLPFDELFRRGTWISFRYTGVWAGGLAIFLCFMRAHKDGKFLNK